MSFRTTFGLAPHRITSRTAGATLIELMISMALTATLTAGGLAAYARVNATYHAASVEQRLQQRAQYVLATLEPELQMAGYFGGAAPPSFSVDDVPAAVRACGAVFLTKLDAALESIPSLPRGCAPRGAVMPGAQILIARRASAHATAPHAGRAQWLLRTVPARSGQMLWQGAPTDVDVAGTELRDLIVRAYYVTRSSDGDVATPALRVKSLTEVAGKPAFVDTEVMPGVEDLQIALQPADAPRTVQLTLQIRTDGADLRAGQAPRHLSITRHFTLRNALRAP
jgi:Tfp pilus assembly protein PilW